MNRFAHKKGVLLLLMLLSMAERICAQSVSNAYSDFYFNTTSLILILGLLAMGLMLLWLHRKQRQTAARVKTLSREIGALRQENDTLQQFNAVAVHDLKSPLRTMTAFTSLFLRKYGRDLNSEGHEYLNFVREGGQRLQRLLDGMPGVSTAKLEEGQVNMNEVVLDAVKNLHLDIQENRAQVNLVRYLPILDGHHGQLVQLVQNVISNSIKYKAPDRHPVVLIDGKEEAEDCVFSITDNGIGIPADQLKRVFQRNVRLHDHQAVEGYGLGLASCKQIVDRMGGEIWIESKVGTGSTLCFRLPKQRKNERPAEAVTPQTREEQNTLRRLRAKSRAAIF